MSEIQITLSDSWSPSDGTSNLMIAQQNIGDYILYLDSLDTFKTFLLQLNDSFVPTDLLEVALLNTTRNVSSTVLWSDQIQVQLTGNPAGISLNDTISFSDLLELLKENTVVNQTFSDTVVFGDSINVFLTSELTNYFRRYLNDVIN